jgi:hypothetical protein
MSSSTLATGINTIPIPENTSKTYKIISKMIPTISSLSLTFLLPLLTTSLTHAAAPNPAPFNLLSDPALIKLDLCQGKDYAGPCANNLHPKEGACTNIAHDWDVQSIELGDRMSCNLHPDSDCQNGYKLITESVPDVHQLLSFKGSNVRVGGLRSFRCRVD